MKTNRQHSLVQSTPKRRNKKWKEKRAKSRRWLPLSSLGNSRGIHLSASYYPFFCSFLLSCYFGGGLFFFLFFTLFSLSSFDGNGRESGPCRGSLYFRTPKCHRNISTRDEKREERKREAVNWIWGDKNTRGIHWNNDLEEAKESLAFPSFWVTSKIGPKWWIESIVFLSHLQCVFSSPSSIQLHFIQEFWRNKKEKASSISHLAAS